MHTLRRVNVAGAAAVCACAALSPAPARACQPHTLLVGPVLGPIAHSTQSGPSVGGPQAPAYHSFPSAQAKVFLDFDGDFTAQWNGYQPGQTPAYSIDADPGTFSAQELTNIHEIWSRISEKYSPFNINVTTVDPGNRNDRETMHVVIGGDGRNGGASYWLGYAAGGVAWTGGFYNNYPNTAFVFPGNLQNGNPKRVSEASAHEAGHGFGLSHQSLYDANGNFITEYNPGTSVKAPIMGTSYAAARGLWWRGPTYSPTSLQDDLVQLSSSFNAFGYRADDHGSAPATATPLGGSGNSVSGHGVIEQTTDADYFSFATLAGEVSFFLDVAPFGPMLDSTLALFDESGLLLAQSATLSLTESITMTVPGGDYLVAVRSAGNYGDVGQYFLSGTIVAVPEPAATAVIAACGFAFLRRRR